MRSDPGLGALSVSRSGLHASRGRELSSQDVKDRALLAHVRRVHRDSREVYGARRVWKELVAQGISCGRHHIARLRRENGIEARRWRRFKVTRYSVQPTVVLQHFQDIIRPRSPPFAVVTWWERSAHSADQAIC
ncbi:IS3 family transposase [Dyella japonica]|uniref:IS3 family transposase n=1 Tax=Dyella japonica TaxID=231455 RepID=UPI003CCD103E